MKSLDTLAFVLVVVGAVNWGLTALGYNVVNMVLGSWAMVETVVYLLVGVAGVYLAATHKWS